MARFNDLPEGLWEEIMSWLPPESLKRFKLVRKSWYRQINALVKDSVFVAKHLRNMKEKTSSSPWCQFSRLFVVQKKNVLEYPVEAAEQDENEITEDDYFLILANADHYNRDYIPCVTEYFGRIRWVFNDYYFSLESQCDGILCFSAKSDRNVCLVNPALREMKVIQSTYFGNDYEVQVVGFGHDSRTNQYKVVAATVLPRDEVFDRPCRAEVYSFTTDSWTEIVFDIESPAGPLEEVYCNGVSYWYASSMDLGMFSFDYSDEIFRVVPLPTLRKEPEVWDGIVDLAKTCVWKESVVLFRYQLDPPFVIEMWLLGSHSGGVKGSYSWTKHLAIGPLEGIRGPLGFWNYVKLILEAVDGEIKVYHLGSEVVSHLSRRLDKFYYDHFVIYHKSLVSLLRKDRRRLVGLV